MRLWQPEPTEPVLLEWYVALFAAARRVRAAEVPWPVNVDEFELLGRADRARHPSVWVYRHRESGGLVCADHDGRTYRFVPHRAGPAQGRFLEIEPRRAVWAASLPSVVAPVWYERPRSHPTYGAHAYDPPAAAAVSQATRWRRKRHLSVVPDPASA